MKFITFWCCMTLHPRHSQALPALPYRQQKSKKEPGFDNILIPPPGYEAIQLAPLYIPDKYTMAITGILNSTEISTHRQILQLCLHIIWQHTWVFMTFQLRPPTFQGVQCLAVPSVRPVGHSPRPALHTAGRCCHPPTTLLWGKNNVQGQSYNWTDVHIVTSLR